MPTQSDDDAARRDAVVFFGASAGAEWGWLEARYAEMAAAAVGAGARFAVLAFPYQAQLGEPRERATQERLRALAQPRGWLLVDPLPAFLAAQRASRAPLFLDWWHPTPAGHRLAAEELGSEPACVGLVPVPEPEPCDPSSVEK